MSTGSTEAGNELPHWIDSWQPHLFLYFHVFRFDLIHTFILLTTMLFSSSRTISKKRGGCAAREGSAAVTTGRRFFWQRNLASREG